MLIFLEKVFRSKNQNKQIFLLNYIFFSIFKFQISHKIVKIKKILIYKSKTKNYAIFNYQVF